MQPRRPRRIVHPSPSPGAPIEERSRGIGHPSPASKQGSARLRRAEAKLPAAPRHAAATAEATAEGTGVRLSKRMAELGLCSRREADVWIERGWVRVNGKKITELGSRVLPAQQIQVEPAARRTQQQQVTILLHKPIGIVSGQAEQGYRPAVGLIGPASRWKEDRSGLAFRAAHLRGLAPAGRLDIDSTGLLVLTQDGRIARQLVGADSHIEKEYLVRVAGSLSASDLQRLQHGLVLDAKPLAPAHVSWLNADQLRFVLIEGRKRQIRRMCEAVGLQVLALKRVRIGRVMLGHLPPGQWRYLGADEGFL